MNKLLLDEHPLQLLPSLATLIGLNEAIVLQQVHYWLTHKQNTKQSFIDGHYWVYNTYEQWHEQFPFWSIMTIRRIFTALEKKNLLIAGNYNRKGFDKTKWYTINYETLKKIVSVQNEHTVCSNCSDVTVQSEQTNTIEYMTETSSKISTTLNVFNGKFNGTVLETSNALQPINNSTPFDFSILEKQIVKACKKQEIDNDSDIIDIIKIITFYYETYMKSFHKEHPRLSAKSMENVVSALYFGSDVIDYLDTKIYKNMIERHFQTEYNDCDYNICHFVTEGIRNNRFYETYY